MGFIEQNSLRIKAVEYDKTYTIVLEQRERLYPPLRITVTVH